MSDFPSGDKLESAQMIYAAIKAIVEKQAISASQSQYDRKVCVRAVATAREAIESVPVNGTGTQYGKVIIATLHELHDTYNDSEGEYTSGKGIIGNVYYDVLGLLDVPTSLKNE